jgi:uncharacterized protein YbaR (Trm112 family)
MNWQAIPVEAQLHVLRFVPRDTLLIAMRVCKEWAGLIAAKESKLWKPVVPGIPGLLPDGIRLASPAAYVLWVGGSRAARTPTWLHFSLPAS